MILRSRCRPSPSKTSGDDSTRDRNLRNDDVELEHERNDHPSLPAAASGENTKGETCMEAKLISCGRPDSNIGNWDRLASTSLSCSDQSSGQSSRQEDLSILEITGKSGQISTGNDIGAFDMNVFDQDARMITSSDWAQEFRHDMVGGVWPTIFSDCIDDMDLREDTEHHTSTYLEPIADISISNAAFLPMPCRSKQIDETETTSAAAEFSQPSAAIRPDMIPSSLSSAAINPDMILSSSSTEQNKEETSIVDDSSACKLTDGDVLLGRGGVANVHPGNARFRAEALRLRPWYEISSKRAKYDISEILIESVNGRGDRFLKKEDDGKWREVDRQKARKKASQALRERQKPSRRCKTMAKAV